MTRFGKQGRVFVIEEPIYYDGPSHLEVSDRGEGIFICVPKLSQDLVPEKISELIATEIESIVEQHHIDKYVAWFYTPMMLPLARSLSPEAVVYDCMDELTGFKNAPPELIEREKELFKLADLVFTGGHSLYEAKKEQHPDVHAFPSSIDKEHFSKAVAIRGENPARVASTRPHIGFIGVIDERLDIALLEAIADLKSEWDFNMVGPVVKIDESDLPRRENIKYFGSKDYSELPAILAGWDVAMMPFALNDSTKYISPTKTPEYLAAGLPVVSTAITDVVRPYGVKELVSIAKTPGEFVAGIETLLNADHSLRRERVADFLKNISWDRTFQSMSELIAEVIESKKRKHSASLSQAV